MMEFESSLNYAVFWFLGRNETLIMCISINLFGLNYSRSKNYRFNTVRSLSNVRTEATQNS